MTASVTPTPTRTRARSVRAVCAVVGAALLALCAAAVVGWHGSGAPVARFLFGPDRVEVAPFDEVPMFDPMVLQVDMPFDGYLYLVSFDYLRGTVSYFPSDFLGTDYRREDGRMNAFAAGTHELPGPWDRKAQSWFVPDVSSVLSLCVVVSRAPLSDLEILLLRTRQVGNTAFANRSMGDYMPRSGRNNRIGQQRLPHDVLLAAQNQEDSVLEGPMVPWAGHQGIFVKVLNIRPGKPRPGAGPPSHPFQDQLKQIQEKAGMAGKKPPGTGK